MHSLTVSQIESLVRSRSRQKAQTAIARYLKAQKGAATATFQACDWYRRLALYKEGLTLVQPERRKAVSRVSSKSSQGKSKLWFARFLNLMGASEFALLTIERVEMHTAIDHRIAANVYLTNFEHEKALRHFQLMAKLEADPESYSARLAMISFADALMGAGQASEAIAIAKGIHEKSPEPLLKGISLQALGEYHACSGQLEQALEMLERAKSFFPAGDQTPDFGMVLKWLGYVYVKTGKSEKGAALIEQAMALLNKPQYRPEGWLDVMRLRVNLGLASQGEALQLLHYPGTPKNFRALLPQATAHVFGDAKRARIKIHLASDEYELEGQRFLGLPLELRLLGLIGCTQSWGLNATRARCLLWATEPEAFLQHENRLHKLIARIRAQYNVDVQYENGLLRLSERAAMQVAIESSPDSKLAPLFLRERKEFTGGDVSQFYSISRTQRAEYLREWEARGWIKSSGKHPRLRYLVCL